MDERSRIRLLHHGARWSDPWAGTTRSWVMGFRWHAKGVGVEPDRCAEFVPDKAVFGVRPVRAGEGVY